MDVPIVLDHFSAQEKRSIAASAGLTGPSAPPAPETASETASSTAVATAASTPVAATGVLELQHNLLHQVAVPPSLSSTYVPLSQHKPLDPPYRSYPFTLDPFQCTSISAIERGESVLVSAHTSAGKTVVAEYAIALCLKGKRRVVYTSPIKVRRFHSLRAMTLADCKSLHRYSSGFE